MSHSEVFMLKVTGELTPTGVKLSAEPTEAALKFVTEKLSPFFFKLPHDKFIDYSYEKAAEAYADSRIHMVQSRSGDCIAPYQLVFDYRTVPSSNNWGTFSFEDEPYLFPGELAGHRKAMEAEYGKRGLLKKGNQPAVRVQNFQIKDGHPYLNLQRAHYYDQVGSNLTLDFHFDKAITVQGQDCHSVREWDVAQASGPKKKLPPFQQSRLANTIGVAIGVTAKSRYGQTHWLRRKRSKTVAVYPGMWHLPFSFALCMDQDGKDVTDLKHLIGFDLNHEKSEELAGLEHSDFGELKPLAFCRDLARGGKPQFFLELPCRVPFEKLKGRVGEHNRAAEFSGDMKLIMDGEEQVYSPELACLRLLTES